MRVLAVLAVCIGLIGVESAAAQETVPLPVRIDGSARIELKLTKSERRDDEPERGSTLTYDVVLEKPDEDGRRSAAWRLTHIDGAAVEAASVTSPNLQMTLDETLTPVSLNNLAEFISATRRQFEAAGEMDNGAADSGMRLLATLTPETAAPLFTADATMIAQGQGTDLVLGEDSAYEFEGALPWGGQVTMLGTYRLVDVDQSAGKARVVWSQEIEPTSLLNAMPTMVEGLVAGKAKPGDSADFAAKMRAQLANARVENSRRCEFTIDIATGLAEAVDCLTVIEFVVGEESARRETRLTATQRFVP